MKKKQRFTFKCWNCPHTYTLFREITTEQISTVACPYCHAEGVVALKLDPKSIKVVLRGDEDSDQSVGEELVLPDVLPTQKPA